ncbi:hypothetical protein Despr_1229 [Desulfobulbus propionicus DSM 2032]|uniref:Uncharacterized protein n=2 Tax=Desulfobulbus propionicus TaxID=894 RepID=A0A7U4DNV2_DESPD|nr:hypothetical protein Despr_1229 [Desulfobulbus propionicus DSM 2032]
MRLCLLSSANQISHREKGMNRLQHLIPLLAVLLTARLLLSASATAAAAVSPTNTPPFHFQLEQVLSTGRSPSSGEPVRQRVGVRDIYAREQCTLLWTPEKVKQLLAAIAASRENGLQPTDYPHQTLLLFGHCLANDPDPSLSVEDGLVCSTERWRSREALEQHLGSSLYSRVFEAMELSRQPPKVEFLQVQDIGGLDMVAQARRGKGVALHQEE